MSLPTFSEERKNDVQNFPSQVGYRLGYAKGGPHRCLLAQYLTNKKFNQPLL